MPKSTRTRERILFSHFPRPVGFLVSGLVVLLMMALAQIAYSWPGELVGWVNGNACDRGETMAYGDEIVYVVHAPAN